VGRFERKSDPASEKTKRLCTTKIISLMLFREIIALYSQKHMKPINTLYGINVELLTANFEIKYIYVQLHFKGSRKELRFMRSPCCLCRPICLPFSV
jgi:hypothetical protein